MPYKPEDKTDTYETQTNILEEKKDSTPVRRTNKSVKVKFKLKITRGMKSTLGMMAEYMGISEKALVNKILWEWKKT